MEHAIDIALSAIVAITFLMTAAALLIPPRPPDALGVTLVVLFATLGVTFLIVAMESLGWVAIPLPPWMRWTLRVVLIGSSIAYMIELLRAGAFRKRRK